MLEKTPTDRIAVLETADQYERRAMEVMQKTIDSLHEEVDSLKDWKRDCDRMSKAWLRIAMAFSLIATSLGVWMDNIKSMFKALFAWVGS